ncbi:MAG: hypothetical protein JSW43_02075 [Gemmatimonadota bacterium]|nr:MAG: hypothetical protein JSW43_02075 [Gemmatimonadota bacterium]
MTRKRLTLLVLALALAGAGACTDSTAPTHVPEGEDAANKKAEKRPPKTGFLILPGERGALLV